jgi:hypothetical protein
MPGEEEGHLPEEALRARAVLVEMQERMANGPHAALGIPMHATASDIRTAFLELTKKFHPARFGRMPTEVQRLSTEVFLSLRAAHDQLAKTARKGSGVFPAITPPNPITASGVTTVRATAQMPPITRTPLQSPEPAQPPARPTPQLSSSRPSPQPNAQLTPRPVPVQPPPTPPPPRRTPTASPPPERRITPPLGVRLTPSPAKGTPPGPVPRASSSAAMPAFDTDLAPIYNLMEKGQWDQARSAISALAARDKTNPAQYEALLHYARGREAQLDRRLDEARVELDSALQLDPSLQIAKTALAELFTRRK